MPRKRNLMSGTVPTYQEETLLLSQGYSLVAGLDEAGRGPLAGPVVAGIAVLPPNPKGQWVRGIRDSKQLTKIQRARILSQLRRFALALEVGVSGSNEIDELGIVNATRLAMERAINSIVFEPQYLLLDAFPLPGVHIPQKPIVRGDELCLSIAAASVVAKVTRDNIMEEADSMYPEYGFAQHKGYPTLEHLRRLRLHGPCDIHRKSYAPVKELLIE